MSSIPPNSNIVGSFLQAGVSSNETSKTKDANRNKRASDAKELAKLADREKSEVEDTEHTDQVIVRREGEQQHSEQGAKDTYEQHKKNMAEKIYHSEEDVQLSTDQPEETPESSKQDTEKSTKSEKDADDDNSLSHIDLTA